MSVLKAVILTSIFSKFNQEEITFYTISDCLIFELQYYKMYLQTVEYLLFLRVIPVCKQYPHVQASSLLILAIQAIDILNYNLKLSS